MFETNTNLAEKLYLKELHIFRIRDKCILLNVRSQEYFELLDSSLEPFLNQLQLSKAAHGKTPIDSSSFLKIKQSELKTLLGILLSTGLVQTEPRVDVKMPAIPKQHNPLIHTLLFNVIHTCNFSCIYCFAEPEVHSVSKMKMSIKTADAAISFLINNSDSEASLGIELFGGEPLLNLPVIKHIVRRVREIDRGRPNPTRFAMPTNGLLLTNEVLDFCDEYGVRVQISMDGPPLIQDRQRRLRNNIDSYDKIIDNVKNHISRHPNGISVRSTIGHGGVHLLDISKHLLTELKFSHLALIEAGGNGKESCTMDDIEEIKKQWVELGEEYIKYAREGKVWPVYPLDRNIERTRTPHKEIEACGAGKGYLTVATDGTLYPCPRFIGRKNFVLGTVFTGLSNPQLRDEFYSNYVDTREDCRKCWARYFCGGKCVALPVDYSGNLKQQPQLTCDLYRRQFEVAMFVNTVLSADGYMLDSGNNTYYNRHKEVEKGMK